MNMSISTTHWKYALLSLSCFISIAAVALMSCGVVALGGAGSEMGALIIALQGLVVFTLCTIGSFAALRESYNLSLLFVISTIATVISQTIYMIGFSIMKSDLMEMAAERVENLWDEEMRQPGAMKHIQTLMYCCGKESPQDYLLDDDDKLPESCCHLGDCTNDANIYTKGCAVAAVTTFDDMSDNLILILLGLIIFEVMAVLAAYFFCKGIKSQNQKLEPTAEPEATA